jgi:ribosomal protein S18 acetylase RimI-like enzyme
MITDEIVVARPGPARRTVWPMTGLVVTGSTDRWLALAAASTIGELRALTRPDGRCFLVFVDCRDDAYGPLVTEAAAELRRDLYTVVDENDEPGRQRLIDLGFAVHRHEHEFRLATDPSQYGLDHDVASPPGCLLASAAEADLDRLRTLDEALRQDIPGTDGWRWTPEGFREQTFGGDDFDPATYLVAVESRTGAYVGLIRVWMNVTGPRLGCLGVLPAFRRTRVTRALVAAAATVLHDRGHRYVVTEISADNRSALALLTGRGAIRTGGAYELVRRDSIARN